MDCEKMILGATGNETAFTIFDIASFGPELIIIMMRSKVYAHPLEQH